MNAMELDGNCVFSSSGERNESVEFLNVGSTVSIDTRTPKVPKMSQPILVAEIDDLEARSFWPVEHEIVCPQCGGFISALMSLNRILANIPTGQP
jgi:hypothetical protein